MRNSAFPDYDIIHENGHYVVYINGKFYCTADKLKEAAREADEYLAERR